MAAPCSRQGATGLSNICLPFDHKWLKPLKCSGFTNMFPKACASNQSPGLNLLFDLNLAYLTAEHEYSVTMREKYCVANLRNSKSAPLAKDPLTLIFLRCCRLTLPVLTDNLPLLRSMALTSFNRTQLGALFSLGVLSTVIPLSPELSSSTTVCIFRAWVKFLLDRLLLSAFFCPA